MREFLKFMLVCVAIFLGINPIAKASGFSSIYSFANTEVGIGPISGITGLPSRTVTLGGSFQNMYDPTSSISGCVIGIAGKNECTYPGSGSLDFSFSKYSYPSSEREIKIYVPKGTINFYFVSHLPQSTIATVALKMGSPPSITSSPSINKESIFQKLVNGEEVVARHDGSGTLNIVWGYANGNNSQGKTEEGRWLYVRFLDIDTGDLYGTSGSILLDLPMYQAWYSATTTKWDANGDPIDTNSGSTGGTTTPPTITPNPATLTQGVPSTIAITSGFTLKSCSASPEAGTVSYANNSITLTPNSTNPVTITCTSTTGATAEAKLPVQAAPATALATITLQNLNGQTISSLPNSDVKNPTPTTITVIPNLGAVLPAPVSPNMSGCIAKFNGIESSDIKWITSSTFQLHPSTQSLNSERTVSIDCGTVKTNFTIKMPFVNKTATALEFNFLPSTGTTGTADLYIAGYIPDVLKNKLTGNIEPAWICRSNDDSYWVYMPGAILPKICKRSVNTNDKVRVTIDSADVAGVGSSSVYDYFFTFSETTLKTGKVQVYGAYTSDNGTTFKFLGDENGSFPSVKALAVFQ